MTTQFLFRPAAAGEQLRILEIIRQAQAQMRAAGSLQWQDGYPALRDIAADITRGNGYVLCRPDRAGEGSIAAYGAVIFDGEPAYEALEGEWLTAGPYVALHRLAVADEEKRQGVATEFMHRVAELGRIRGIGALRVDTNFDNRPMLRLLAREGFVHCGTVRYPSGERLAFERPL